MNEDTHTTSIEQVYWGFLQFNRNHPNPPASLEKPLQAISSTAPSDWANFVRQNTNMDLELTHLSPVYELPSHGDLLLLQFQENQACLLTWDHNEWRAILPNGSTEAFPSQRIPHIQQAVLFKQPQQSITNNKELSTITNMLKKEWIEIGLSSLLINFGLLLLPLFSMLIYDKVVNNGIFETLWALTIGMLIYVASDIVMRLLRNWSTENIAHQLSLKADHKLWKNLLSELKAPMHFAKVLTYYRDLSSARDFISSHYLLALIDIPFLALYLIAIALISWPLAIVALILVAIYTIASHIVQKKVTAINKETEKSMSSKMSFLSDTIQNIDLVKTSKQQDWFRQQWDKHSTHTATNDARKRYISGLGNVLASTLSSITSITMLVVGCYLINAKLLSVGGLIASNLLASRAMSIVSAFYTVFAKWQDFKRASQKLDDEMATRHSETQSNTAKPSTQGQISIIEASKSHPNRPPLLQHINLRIQAGERIALLGKPGAGKSTLLKALAGLCPLDQGSILIDGIDVHHIAHADRAQWMTWKGQDLKLFSGTLAENLMIFGPQAHTPQLEQALWISTLEDELRTGKLSLNMHIDEQGMNLSGGQRQKIALARTLAQNARILLLDEPTQGLDSDTEQTIVKRLNSQLPRENTLILTTHSSAVLSLTQRIIALDQGKIVADGPTEKLLVTKPLAQA